MKMARRVRIAQISCGTEYSGIQKEIEKAAEIVGGKIFIPEVDLSEIDRSRTKLDSMLQVPA